MYLKLLYSFLAKKEKQDQLFNVHDNNLEFGKLVKQEIDSITKFHKDLFKKLKEKDHWLVLISKKNP